MKPEAQLMPKLLPLLRCPASGQRLHLKGSDGPGSSIEEGYLETENGRFRYPVVRGIPRFVSMENYAENFGMQWNKFSKTQLDSYSGCPISSDRFWKATGWDPESLRGKWILDVGCGAGRFAEIALQAGANLVALDFSAAVDACYSNLASFPNLQVIQGNIYELPFAPSSFDFVYCLGVLQHTPDVEAAFKSLPVMLNGNGKICVDFYWKRFRTMMHAKYVFRPLTKRLPQKTLFRILEKIVPIMLPVSQALGHIPLLGIYLKRLIPVADYTGRYPLDKNQLKEWALLDTFDMLAPAYDKPQSVETVQKWFDEAGIRDVEVFQEGHLVGRGFVSR